MADANLTSEREHRVNEVLAGYLEAKRLGQAANREDLLRQHPDLADELRSFFADQDRFGQLAEQISPAAAAKPVPTLAPGETTPNIAVLGTVRYFGDYELLLEIARGGMGVVYKARQVSLSRTVALKMILAGQLASTEDVQRFHREAEAAANLDHPHIVPIHEVGEYEGQHYFSMKLIDGGSLASKHMPVPDRQAAILISTVARAVHHAHQRGVLHRDLKPANILLDAAGQPHVTDFGLARRAAGPESQLGEQGVTRTGNIVGTPSYMAPEQARAEKGTSVGVDVYSLGAILYELLSGRPPFRAGTPLDTVLQVLDCEPEPPHKFNPRTNYDLETICLKCLEKDPQRRYGSAEALADDVDRWLSGEPIVARPSTLRERALKWIKRRPAAAALIGVSIAAAAALLIVGLFFDARLRLALLRVVEVKRDAEADRERARQTNERAQQRFTHAQGLLFTAQSSVALPTNPTLALLLGIEGARRMPGFQSNTALQAALESCWEEHALLGHRDQVTALAYSPDGRRMLTASRDKTARLWDTAAGKLLSVLEGHEAGITFATFSPDGRRALTLAPGPDRSVIIWDADTGKRLVRMKLSSPWDSRF